MFIGFGTRPRVVLSPTRPHHAAGSRVEPPPSLAWAIGTSPAATAAADPPLLPDGDRVRSHGLLVGPAPSGCVVGLLPSSGRFVLPTVMSPASRNRAPSAVSPWLITPAALRARLPSQYGNPCCVAPMSLMRNGTPANGAPGPVAVAAARARSASVWMTAFRVGLWASIRSSAASTSSVAVASPERTRSACAVASSDARSVIFST